VLIYTFSGFCSALAGVVFTFYMLSGYGLHAIGLELDAIAAVVIGGTLLTGGYGSAIGAVFGALIFGMVRQGIVITGVNADWFQVFLGAMLIVAVLVNNYIRKKAAEAKR
jgi:ribose/xylose/arabinose/galactoside ABC-type transport system permease subunit